MNCNTRRQVLQKVIEKISRAVSKGGEGYTSDIHISSDGNRAAGLVSRGSIGTLFCCGLCAACFCPYNKWIVKLWFQGDVLQWEISRESNLCVHLCFSGWIGLIILNNQYGDMRRCVSESIKSVQANGILGSGGGGYSQPQSPLFQPPPPYTSPAASAPETQYMHKVDGVQPAFAPAVNAYSANEVPIATAWVVDDSMVGSDYNTIPSVQFTDINNWLQNDTK
ncbi:hypothetical protein TrVE_jg685 [Triparma verrucosa]|uniref:Uncharacterized protein n=1 Tax=Triparma verrucosa TaxID=1606542 RepID=A0A9W6ZGV0_9STRA|nr:hypothetical protein TrVE_jg685 [Triparma verrucosa]